MAIGERTELALAVNRMVAEGQLEGPVAFTRDHLDAGAMTHPKIMTENMRDGSDAITDWPLINALAMASSQADLVAIHSGGGGYAGFMTSAGVTVIADGTPPQLLPTQTGDYTAQVTSEYGCVALSAPYTYIFTDVAEAAGRTLRVAPNPMGDQAVLHLSEPLTAQHHIELVDVSGRVLRVLRPTGRSVTLFREGLGAGPYILRLMRDEEVIGAVRVVVR